MAVVVLPTPADPENSKCGISAGFAIRASKLPIISVWFTISESFVGRYFSTHMPVDNMLTTSLRPTNKSKLVGSIDLTKW
jgi:hypothetical protein